MPAGRWPRIERFGPWPLFMVVIVVVVIGWWWYFATPTTVLIVRHAEKASATAINPHLSGPGQTRAAELARTLGDAGVDAIYVTEFFRTQETMEALANQEGITAVEIPASDVQDLADEILSEHRGEVVAVAGHSNTVTQLIETLGAGSPCPEMFAAGPGTDCLVPDSQYDNLFVVTIPRWGGRVAVRLRYGAHTP